MLKNGKYLLQIYPVCDILNKTKNIKVGTYMKTKLLSFVITITMILSVLSGCERDNNNNSANDSSSSTLESIIEDTSKNEGPESESLEKLR